MINRLSNQLINTIFLIVCSTYCLSCKESKGDASINSDYLNGTWIKHSADLTVIVNFIDNKYASVKRFRKQIGQWEGGDKRIKPCPFSTFCFPKVYRLSLGRGFLSARGCRKTDPPTEQNSFRLCMNKLFLSIIKNNYCLLIASIFSM